MRLTAIMLRVLADGVGLYGISVATLVHGTRVPPELFGDRDGLVAEEDFDRLVGRAVALTGDDAFGLHWAERTSFAAFDVMGHVVAAVPTFGDAIDAILHLFPLISDGNELELRLEDKSAILDYRLRRAPPPSGYVREEFIVASSVRLLRLFAGAAGAPSSAHFTYPAPAHRSEYTRVFGGIERFEQPFTGIVFDRKLLEARQLRHDAELERDLRVHAEVRLRRSTIPHEYAKRVRECLLDGSLAGRTDMKAVAERLGMSERSLRRHLAADGVSFQDLRIEALSARAKLLLAKPVLQIKEIASTMGFSDATAFHRAFKRWTGMTAAAFRTAACATALKGNREDADTRTAYCPHTRSRGIHAAFRS
jgi:AraC-like DNA-binding protein